ncbi:terminase small subunit [Budvicia aquatica]|uniref:Terminase small subunit n=2 Tax=Budvicia aquatica TaxID=82979 RepID=A0A2C6DJV1_9GAMM|nr:terminase small subunit [Budvicia aquatica]
MVVCSRKKVCTQRFALNKMRTTANQKKTRTKNDELPGTESVETEGKNNSIQLSINPDEYGLSERQAIFVFEYLRCRNKYKAYKAAGYKCEGLTGRSAARRMYRNVSLNRVIKYAIQAQLARIEFDADCVVREWVSIATADPNELSQLRRVNCRHCWGTKHHYQWKDEAEFFTAESLAVKDNVPPPSDRGGYGFTSNDDPNPDCPKCNGEGHQELFLPDTRDLSPSAQKLYAGAKQTKNGLEIQTRDQDGALKLLAQHLGMFNKSDNNNQPIIVNNALDLPGDDDDDEV